MMYRMPPHVVAGLGGLDLAALGIPSEADYVRTYCQRTGRDDIPGYDFYIAFNLFRLAAIFHGIKGRIIRGTAASANARDRVRAMPVITVLARKAMEMCIAV
jgi:aminoglycoside phosphotransferase (APT) family kinase protein